MFYCESCREKNEWPDGLMKSFGICECCGTVDECSDVPSNQLPLPTQDVFVSEDKDESE